MPSRPWQQPGVAAVTPGALLTPTSHAGPLAARQGCRIWAGGRECPAYGRTAASPGNAAGAAAASSRQPWQPSHVTAWPCRRWPPCGGSAGLPLRRRARVDRHSRCQARQVWQTGACGAAKGVQPKLCSSPTPCCSLDGRLLQLRRAQVHATCLVHSCSWPAPPGWVGAGGGGGALSPGTWQGPQAIQLPAGERAAAPRQAAKLVARPAARQAAQEQRGRPATLDQLLHAQHVSKCVAGPALGCRLQAVGSERACHMASTHLQVSRGASGGSEL